MTNAQELRLEAQAKAKSDALNRSLTATVEAQRECRRLKRMINVLATTMLILMVSGGYYVYQGVGKVDYRDYSHDQWSKDRLKTK